MENDPKTITFLINEPNTFPAPVPAAQNVPDWLKQMPPEVPFSVPGQPPQPNSTLKRCMPFVDAMTSGYHIPVPCDVRFSRVDRHNIDIISPEHLITWQSQQIFPNTPFSNELILKFKNPWLVQTPPGYSTLFLPIINQMTMPFHVIAGVVETDTYYNEVFFPVICLLQPGQTFELKRGTPIVQAIPIKREPWTSKVSKVDMERLAAFKSGHEANPHIYRDENWEKKSYR